MKKILSLVLALCMLLMVGVVFAEPPAASPLTPAASTADTAGSNDSTWRGAKDGWISITGLDEGDKVKFYQILAYDQNAYKKVADAESVTEGAGSWKAITPFTGMSLDDFKEILTTGISVEIAGRLAGMVSGDGILATADKNGFAAVRAPAAGLYIALITPADPETVYNPVFVGADYYTNDSGAWALTADMSYADTAMAKKEKIDLNKDIIGEGDTRFDVKVGDTVNFEITSKVPAYSTAYEAPFYELTDTLDIGLILQGKPTVTIADLEIVENTDYKITTAENGQSFKIEVLSKGLEKVAAKGVAKVITVNYSAKVTSITDFNINEKDNTATVKFSNNPGDKTKYSLLEDRTRNYTFSLDANLLGHTGYENSELVKIGMDAAGNEITQETLSNHESAGILNGAEFGLYTDLACETLYVNDVFTTGKVTSTGLGKLHINGLDAGTYYLKELNAPDGYIKSQDIYKIEITTEYEDVAAGSYTNSDGILVKYGAYRILKSYDVKVTNLTTNEVITSEFTISNEGTYDKKATIVNEADETTKIANTRGVELPSTGGIGTTIFYILGGVLVIGAAVILVARRKAHD